MIDGNRMYRTEMFSNEDCSALKCHECENYSVRIERRTERYQCIEKRYMRCNQDRVYVKRNGKNLICNGFCVKKSNNGTRRQKTKSFICRDCEFARGLYCRHPRILESAKAYEERTQKHITKTSWFLGWKMPKTSLRWCPLKEIEYSKRRSKA